MVSPSSHYHDQLTFTLRAAHAAQQRPEYAKQPQEMCHKETTHNTTPQHCTTHTATQHTEEQRHTTQPNPNATKDTGQNTHNTGKQTATQDSTGRKRRTETARRPRRTTTRREEEENQCTFGENRRGIKKKYISGQQKRNRPNVSRREKRGACRETFFRGL